MPLGERIIQPRDLGTPRIKVHPVDTTTCAANALVGVLQQLASLVRHADDIFCDITEECQKVFDRSDSIGGRLQRLEEYVRNLDAKAVQIPVGDLSKFSKCDYHHTAKHGFDCDLFTNESRPQCVKDQYHLSDRTPSRILRGADLYRKDGLCSSRLFRLWPIVLHEHKVKTPDLNLPRRAQGVDFQKRYKRLSNRRKTIQITDDLFKDEKSDNVKEDEDMDKPDLQVVPVDVSGTGFHRMESFRKALASIEYEDVKAKKKRRRTISGVSENILQEIELFEQKRKSTSGGDKMRDYNFDDIDPPEQDVTRDEEMSKYLDEIDAKIEERKEDEYFLKERKILKFFPCRRSKSLPRCVKLGGVKAALDKKSLADEITGLNGSSATLSSLGSNGSRQSRSTKRSSIIGNKIRALVRSASGSRLEKVVKPRPKSLDLDAIDFEDPHRRSNLAKMPSMPDCMLNRSNSALDASKVGPGSYYNFETESNTLPRRQVKRNDYMWDGMPKDWTTSVKLREISKRRSVCTDRQSSSGHWSGSNSNRHSLDSDHVKTSQYSLGQDSGRDSPLPDESRCGTESTGYAGDDASTLAGDTDSVHENKLDTDAWLKQLAIRAAGRDEVTSSSAETLSSLTRLTKKNIMALDLMMSSPKRKPAIFDDGESSVYSVDQEGFYTSFHNDSGLKKSTATLVDEEDLSPSKDSQSVASMCSIESVIHNPDAEKYAGIKRGSSKLNKVAPPAPPPRTSSSSASLSSTGGEGDQSISAGVVSRQDSSISDTDQETISNRVLSKTQISATATPSLCPQLSDEDFSSGKEGESVGNSKCEIVDINQNLDVPAMKPEESKGALPQLLDEEINFEQSKTLPRAIHSKVKGMSTFASNTNSWPRSLNKQKEIDSPTKTGILKSNEKSLNDPRPPKSLNFSPVVNMFNPGAPLAVQMPLPSPSSSEDGGKGDQTSLAKIATKDSYKLTVPLHLEPTAHTAEEVPMKYQPTIVVKPGNRPSQGEKVDPYVKFNSIKDQNMPSEKIFYATGSLTNAAPGNITGNKPTPYAVSPIKGAATQNVVTFSKSDVGYMDMQGGNSLNSLQFGSMNSLESSESWSNSLTYVTMASPCSSPNLSNLDVPMLNTPTGSFESLNDQSSSNDQSKTSKASDQTSSFNISDESTFALPLSDTIDNSNLSTTIETVAITTNSFSSYNGTDSELENKSFRTFTGPINPPKSSSTPYASSDQIEQRPKGRDQRTPVLQNSIQSRPAALTPIRTDNQGVNNQNRRRTKDIVNNVTDSGPKKGMPHSQSCPQNMSSHASSANSKSKESKRTENYRPHRKSLPGAIVNLQNVSTNSDEAMNDSSSSNRSDSYRVAMVNPNNSRNGSYRVAMRESLSCPSFQKQAVKAQPHSSSSTRNKSSSSVNPNKSLPSRPTYPPPAAPNPEDFNRTDSYRIAVRGTNGVINQETVAGRNSSYRVAVDVMDMVIPDARMEGLVSGHSGSQMSGRDSRRMGITNVDQLKSVSVTNNTNSANKVDTSSVVRRRPKTDVDPISEISNRDAQRANNRTGKNSSKRHSTSSTYIKFDPIFELSEDMGVSMESLKMGSNSSLKMTPDMPQMVSKDMPQTGYGFTTEKPKINAMNGTKFSSDKSGSKFLGSIKSTIKSISGSNSKHSREFDIEDDWRFSMV